MYRHTIPALIAATLALTLVGPNSFVYADINGHGQSYAPSFGGSTYAGTALGSTPFSYKDGLSINGGTFDISKNVQEIPTQTLYIGSPVTITTKLWEYGGTYQIQGVALFLNLREPSTVAYNTCVNSHGQETCYNAVSTNGNATNNQNTTNQFVNPTFNSGAGRTTPPSNNTSNTCVSSHGQETCYNAVSSNKGTTNSTQGVTYNKCVYSHGQQICYHAVSSKTDVTNYQNTTNQFTNPTFNSGAGKTTPQANSYTKCVSSHGQETCYNAIAYNPNPSNSDTWVQYSKTTGVTVNDPHHILGTVTADVKYDQQFMYVTFHFAPNKPMDTSWIILTAWDKQLSVGTAKVGNAIKISYVPFAYH